MNRRELIAVAVLSSVLTALLLGGGVAAALNVPNNSVNSAKIVDGTIRGVDLRNGTITDDDLSRGSRTYWGVVRFDAGVPSLVDGQGIGEVVDNGVGGANVFWNVDIDSCAVQVTYHSDLQNTPGPLGFITSQRFHTIDDRLGTYVTMHDTSNAAVDLTAGAGFVITANC